MELPIITFIQTRLQEADPTFEVRQGTAHYDLFVEPQEFMLQPINDFMSTRFVASSVRLMLQDPTPDTPTTFASADVDNLASNLYVTRDTGALATGIVTVYYTTPKLVEYPALTAQFTAGSLNFFNSGDYTITEAQMALQSNGSLFYANIPVQAEQAGANYVLPAGSITAILNDPDAVLVTNQAATVGGLDAQTNTQLLDSIPNSIGVRDLETDKGINAILTENFPFLSQIETIGMGDPEMQRDIEYNIHIGAHTDVYLKTPTLTVGTFTANDLVIDTTRELENNIHIMMATSETDPLYPAYTGTLSIVPSSVVVKEDVVDTAASITSLVISSSAGINLTLTPYLHLSIDGGTAVQVKISGVIPSATQASEIANAINTALGLDVAAVNGVNAVVITSPTVGQGSAITFYASASPVSSGQNAAFVLFGLSLGSLPTTISGVTATTYTEGIDYEVDYANGLIYQTTFATPPTGPRVPGTQSITSGQTMLNTGLATGKITETGGQYYFGDASSSEFYNPPLVLVRVGDEVTITSINGVLSGTVLGIPLPSTFIVSEVVNNNTLELSGFNPTGTSTAVIYSIVSQQTVNITYEYNPISIDIGGQVLLSDGLTRGIRPGRSAYTITDTPFINILSIQEIDPSTGEPIGNALNPPTGYGGGGYGQGGYGVGNSGDYQFIVNSPSERFSVFEDSMIVFSEAAQGLSYLVTYNYNPELQAIHTLTRTDGERVTGADVLVKSFIPGFVDMNIGIRRDATNTSTPADADLIVLVGNLINGLTSGEALTASAVEGVLTGQGVLSIQQPLTMTATVENPDGSTTILTAQDELQFPAVTLPSQTSNYTTARIMHFWPRNITLTDLTS